MCTDAYTALLEPPNSQIKGKETGRWCDNLGLRLISWKVRVRHLKLMVPLASTSNIFRMLLMNSSPLWRTSYRTAGLARNVPTLPAPPPPAPPPAPTPPPPPPPPPHHTTPCDYFFDQNIYVWSNVVPVRAAQ